MTKDELMEMARDAGLDVGLCPWSNTPDDWVEGETNSLQIFAGLIAKYTERKTIVLCARICEQESQNHGEKSGGNDQWAADCLDIAAGKIMNMHTSMETEESK